MLTCYAEKRACYSLISYKTKKTQSCTDRSRAETSNRSSPAESFIARDGTRTRDPDLGKVVLYQLSHVRIGEEI